jgi:hypothetical protein
MEFDEYPPARPSGCEFHNDCAECISAAAAAEIDENDAKIPFDEFPCVKCHSCGGRVVVGECRVITAERTINLHNTHVKICPTCIEDYGGADVDDSFHVIEHFLDFEAARAADAAETVAAGLRADRHILMLLIIDTYVRTRIVSEMILSYV